ncbi:MAG TPA: hypothetical protein VHT04_14075 [Stellaceae bacterium]|jgi:hypothetical protein|nr:hypothetical protein [Stellaceae bacterium]
MLSPKRTGECCHEPSDVERRGLPGFTLRGAKGAMRKGYSDARIAASRQTASHNIGLFFELNEFPQAHLTQRTVSAALGISHDLDQLRLRHAIERRQGRRAY